MYWLTTKFVPFCLFGCRWVQFSTMPTSSEPDADKSKQGKKQETERKEYTKEPLSAPKALLKRSSRFFSASFFSSKVDGKFTPTSVFRGLMTSVQKQAPKLVLGILLLGAG